MENKTKESQSHLIETEQEYYAAIAKYEEVKKSERNSESHKLKRLLINLISTYEKANTHLTEVDPVEFIKIRMKDFGYKTADHNTTSY